MRVMDASITQKICNGIYFTDDKKLVKVEYNQLNSTLSRYNNNIDVVRCAQIQNGHWSISSEPSALGVIGKISMSDKSVG